MFLECTLHSDTMLFIVRTFISRDSELIRTNFFAAGTGDIYRSLRHSHIISQAEPLYTSSTFTLFKVW